jgi:hypothetical protein
VGPRRPATRRLRSSSLRSLPALPESVAVLRQRDFRLMFGAQAVSHFGDRMVPIALAFAVLELGGSATAVGLVLASQTFALVGCL